VHVLLMRGQLILENLFPGIMQELRLAGAPTQDTAADVLWLTPAGWAKRFQSGMVKLNASRNLLEHAIRRRLTGCNNVRVIDQCSVGGLISANNTGQVSGVRLRCRGVTSDGTPSEPRLHADVVVDATGRGSPAPRWLEELGYESPRETVVNAFLGYASRMYKIPSGFQADWKMIMLQPAPPLHPRAGLLYPIEGNRWVISVGGGDHDYPPTDEEGFLKFVRSLASPIIYELIKDAEPLSPIYGYRPTENRLRHYDKLARLPEGLLLVGDSVCSFNPVYGQGMTTAAMAAVLLDDCMHEQNKQHPDGSLVGLTKKFQKRLARLTAGPWMLATSSDFRFRTTEGNRPGLRLKLMHRYVDHVVALGTESEEIRRRWLEVTQMLKPPTALFHPAMLRGVLRRAIGLNKLSAPVTESRRTFIQREPVRG
jgi:2-polyprenyl-6-methoxyphenol hydroxylase-like FAD-dependent oxidoreductase